MSYKRETTLPTRIYKTATPDITPKCVGCGVDVDGFCYTGSIIDGLGFTTIHTTEKLNLTPAVQRMVIQTFDKTTILGGDESEVTKRISYFKRRKGLLCHNCASNYGTVTDNHGNKHEIVKTDSKQSYVKGSLPIRSGRLDGSIDDI